MKPMGRLLPLICMLVTALLVPTGAIAKPDHSGPSFDRSAEAHLAGTHGYRITISATNSDVTVSVKNGTASVTYYSFASELMGDRIDVRLPRVGRISLRFHERSRSHLRHPHGCRGRSTLIRRGVFVGWIKIRGERDYTRAESRHVRGEIVREPRSGCGRRPTAHASSASSRWVAAEATRGGGRLSFMASAFPLSKSYTAVIFVASLLKIRGEMVILSSQNVANKDVGALEFAAPPRSATVAPPAPFSGTATFQQESADEFSWTGDLAVELPGSGEVSLAGPKFETALCLERRCRGDDELAEIGQFIVAILP